MEKASSTVDDGAVKMDGKEADSYHKCSSEYHHIAEDGYERCECSDR